MIDCANWQSKTKSGNLGVSTDSLLELSFFWNILGSQKLLMRVDKFSVSSKQLFVQ